MFEFENREEFARWIYGKPRDLVAVLAARAALRAAPALATVPGLRGGMEQAGRHVILPVFRGLAESWVTGAYPTSGAEPHNSGAAVAIRAEATARGARAAAARSGVAASHVAYAAASACDAEALYGTNHAVSAAEYAADAARLASQGSSGRDIYAAIADDAQKIVLYRVKPSSLAFHPLWPKGMPDWAEKAWQELSHALLSHQQDWHVWTQWYEARLKGGQANETLEIARMMIQEDVWAHGPEVVNAEIKRLIGEHKQNRNEPPQQSVEKKPPAVPRQRPAAVEPIWEDGRLTVVTTPAKVDLEKREFAAALSALRAEMRDFGADIAREANIDTRFISFVYGIADRIPERPPRQDELFRLGHVEEVFARYAETVDSEWPKILASRYYAIALQFDRTMRQFKAWRDFKRNAEKDKLKSEQILAATSLAAEAANALREHEAREFVDPVVPQILEHLVTVSSELSTDSDEQPLGAFEAGQQELAADLVESVNNILKRVAEAALRAGGPAVRRAKAVVGKTASAYADQLERGAIAEAKKLGRVHGEKIIRWLGRITVGGAAVGLGAAGAHGIGAFTGLAKLIAKYPQAFSWLESILKFFS